MSTLAFLRFDPDRAPEQDAFARSRVTVLRESGGQLWVRLEDPQVATLQAEGIEVTPYADAGELALGPLRWRPLEETPQPPAALTAATPGGTDTADWLLLFAAPPDKSWLQELMLAGAEPLQQLSLTASVYRMTSETCDAVRALPQVAGVSLFHPAYVPALELCGLDDPLDAAGLASLSLQLPPASAEDGNLLVQAFEALDAASLQPALEAAGATVVMPVDHGFLLNVADAGQAAAVLSVRGLHSATLPGIVSADTMNAGVIVGANQVRDLGTVNFLVNLDGLGEIGAVVDSGFDVGNLAGGPVAGVMTPFHPDLATNIRLLANTANLQVPAPVPGNNPHGTHVAGTVCGDGSGSGNLTRGIAPRAALIGIGPFPAAGAIAAPFSFAADRGASVINNSWGINPATGTNNRYGAFATTADRWCHDNPDVLIVFTAGNLESDTFPAPDGVLDARTLRQHSLAKNVLCIGCTENLHNDAGWRDSYRALLAGRYTHAAFNATAGGAAGAFTMSDNSAQVALFSNRGLVRDAGNTSTGRVKPDICAPGTNVVSARSQMLGPAVALPGPPPIADPFYANNFGSMLPAALTALRNLYMVDSGTSMSAPVISGSALLVRQYYRTRHAQLRRPLLLQGVPMPASPAAQPGFPSRPAIAQHPDGIVCAWVTPALPAAATQVVAMRVARHHQGPVDAVPVVLQAGVGEHPALALATLADKTFVLHRQADGKARLSAYDRQLAPLAAFGTNGVVTLAQDARLDDTVAPALLTANNHVICLWPTSPGQGFFFQRFDAANGAAVDAAPVNLMTTDGSGQQQAAAYDGDRVTLAGVLHGASFQLTLRQVDGSAQLHPAAAVIAVDQAAEVREPCLLWDPLLRRYWVAWCDARTAAGGELFIAGFDAQLAPVVAPKLLVSTGAAGHMRRPQLALHPSGGYLLAWEDDSQNAHFDLYLTLLDTTGSVDGRIAADASAGGRSAVRVTDSPGDANGFALFGDAAGFVLTYQNPDEVNSDAIGVYLQTLTPDLAFEAQADTATPFLRNGKYQVLTLLDHANTVLTPVAAAWTGATWDLMRGAPGLNLTDNQQWLRLGADGVPDARHGANGIRERIYGGLVINVEMLWTGNNRRISVSNDVLAGVTVYLDDADGAPVATFGTGGARVIADAAMPPHDRTPPQLGFFTVPAFTIIVAYGSLQGATLHLRQQRLRADGSSAGTPADLATCDGVAAHGWYQFVNGIEACGVAVYHRTAGANTQVLCRRFSPAGAPLAAEAVLSSAAGEARNAVIARRPIAINSPRREYGAAWQYRAAAGSPFEIRFGRIDRLGQPMATPPVAGPPPAPGVLPSVTDVRVIEPATPGWSATRDAVEPQLVSTYLHEAWTAPPAGVPLPEWSPSWGLAWIGVEAGSGVRRLYFTVLDENGRRLAVPQPPPAIGALLPPAPAAILAFGSPTGFVQDFRLTWNGRIFMLAWTEQEAGQLKQRCTLINRRASQDAYSLPSAALLRATLVNGATNLTPAALPDRTAGYGWGLINLRQSLAPALPFTLQVRDDCALGPGRAVRYVFTLPAGTALLRVTLTWTDPPGPNLLRHLHLTVRAPVPPAPGVRTQYFGNLWDTAPGRTHLSRAVANPPGATDVHENQQPYKQVVVANPPAGDYEVEVSVAGFGTDLFNQQNLQPFALVFAGTGPEQRFNQPVAAVVGTPTY
ncbi:S8 family serine peptidase [Roseateles sp. BYS78W]|uniref:S8 family serine peptidase n=1 Tax=Pelomonas candidula TaxID=3299025 RepID=A0ABW7HGQ7_9BURK